MRTSTTLILAALVGAVGAFIYYAERHAPSTSEIAANAHLLATASPEETVEIQLRDATGRTELRRENPQKSWRIVRPFRDRADPDAASALFSLATTLEVVERLDSSYEVQGIDPFDTASREIILENQSGDPLVHVQIGKPAALTDTVYARDLLSGSDTIAIVRSPHLSVLSKSTTSFRDPRLLDVASTDVTTLRIRTASGGLTLDRLSPSSGSTKAIWQITEPLDTTAEPGTVDAIVKALTSARVKAHTATGEGSAIVPASFDEPTATVTVVSGTIDKTTIKLLEVAPGTVLATTSERRPVIFEVSPSILSAVLARPQEIRSITLAIIDPELLIGLDYTLANNLPIKLRRTATSAWQYGTAKNPISANSDRIIDLVETVNTTPILDFANDAPTDLAPYGLTNPAATLSFISIPNPRDPSITTTSTLLLGRGRDTPNKLFATFTDRPFVYQIGPSLLAALPTDSIAFHSTQVTGISAFDLQSITIAEGAAPPFSLVRNPTTFRWSASRPGIDLTPRLDQTRANLIAAALSTFYADRWLTRRSDALDRLSSNPSLIVTITLSNNEPPVVLSFAPPSDSASNPEFYIGTRQGLPEVFLINKTTYSALTTSLLEE